MKQLTKKISVITPVYNSEEFLEHTIQRVLSQNYPAIEFIIVDDGSTDKSASIIQQFPQVTYLYQENAGPASARNLGLQAATGEYIIFIDSDDFWEENSLISLAEYLDHNLEVQIIEGKIREFYFDNVTGNFHFSTESYYTSNFGSCMFRREVFDIVGNFNEKLRCAEDIDWFIRSWENNILKKRMNAILLNYRKHPESLTTRLNTKQHFYRLLVFKLKIERNFNIKQILEEDLNTYIGSRD